MRLHWSPRSPFVRKVTMALHEIGLTDRVDFVRTEVSFVKVPSPEVLALNPLGQIPILETDDGRVLYESGVICAYLDTLGAGPRLLPEGAEGIAHLGWQALGDGVTELLLRWQVSQRSTEAGPFREAARAKLGASLAAMAREVPKLGDMPFGLGHIAFIAALGHLDFRFGDSNWRAAFPDLARWADGLASRPSVAATLPADEANAPLAARSQGLDFLDDQPR